MLKARCYNELAFYFHTIGRVNQAIQIFQDSALAILKGDNSGEQYLKSETYRLLGWSYERLGNYDAARYYKEKNLELKKIFLPKNHFKIGEAYYWLAILYYHLDMYNKSEEYIRKALPIFEASSFNTYLIGAHLFLGMTAHNKGNYNKAIAEYEKTIDLCKGYSGFLFEPFTANYNKAFALYEKGKIDEANELLKRTIKNFVEKTNPNHLSLVQMYLLQGFIYKKMNLYDSVHSAFKRSLQILNKNNIKNHIELALGQNIYAEYALEVGDLDLADSLISKALNYANPLLSYNITNADSVYRSFEQIMSFYLAGKYFYLKYIKQSGPTKYLIKSDEFLEHCRLLFLNYKTNFKFQTRDKFFRNEVHNRIFRQYVTTLFTLFSKSKNEDYLNRAFKGSEEIKGGALIEIQNSIAAFSNIPDTILSKEESLKNQLNYIQSEIAEKTTNKLLRNTLHAELFRADASYDSLITYLEKNYPEYYNLKYNFDVLSIKEVQQKLKPNEALIEYFNGDEETYAFTLTADTVFFEALPLVSTAEVESFRNVLSPNFVNQAPSEIFKDYTGSAYGLYQKTLAPLLKHINPNKINSLKVIPDGVMSLVPFETLLTAPADGKAGDYKSLPYLMKQFNISYGYSSTSLFKMTSKQTEYPHDGVLAFAPGKYLSSEETTGFSPLKWNKTEVNDLSNYFNGDVLTGATATEEAFKEKIQQYPIAHLAMHAVVDNEDPMYSKLLFAPPQDTLEDGMLHTFELYNMRLNTQMVVLSACNTGYGKLQRGEGVMSLSRAFAYAGCPSIVMSHWAVDDKTTSELMKYFYQHLSEGESKDVALRNAKLDFLNNSSPLYQHPYFWNNFVVLGDTAPVAASTNYLAKIFIAFLFMIVIGATFYGIRRYKRGNF